MGYLGLVGNEGGDGTQGADEALPNGLFRISWKLVPEPENFGEVSALPNGLFRISWKL